MPKEVVTLPAGKKVYVASDFHLGATAISANRKREQIVVNWLNSIKEDAALIILLGDIFDFWFEYKHVIPKGFVRIQGKLAELADAGIDMMIFTGNHDLWMFDYFPTEFGITVYHEPFSITLNDKKVMVGHGDGLGPGDNKYKALKKIFRNRFLQWAFSLIHPNLGIGLAKRWSGHSREASYRNQKPFMGEEEPIYLHCREVEKKQHHDYYIFGHRHLPMEIDVNAKSKYINVGEWINFFTYGEFDGIEFRLMSFKDEAAVVTAN